MGRAFLWISVVLVLMVGVLILWTLIAFPSDQRPAMLTAVGTLGAVFMSTLFSIDALMRQHRREKLDSQSRAAIEHKGQAEEVWWWIAECKEHGLLLVGRDKASFDECWGFALIVENRSAFPISDVHLISHHYLLPYLEDSFFKSIGPTARRTYHLVSGGNSLLSSIGKPQTQIAFQDKNGARWLRLESGALLEVTDTTFAPEKDAASASSAQLRDLEDAAEHEVANALNYEIRESIRSGTVDDFQHEFDERTFQVLQRWPHGHVLRGTSELWWRVRSGKIDAQQILAMNTVR